MEVQGNSDCKSIAVIGYGCRFPGANNPDDLWDIVLNKFDATDEIPKNRQCKTKIQSHIKRGGFLKCPVDEFDANFFGISSEGSEILDPRQRLLLEVTWESLEDAGIDSVTLRGSKTDVFVGLWSPDYEKVVDDHRKIGCPHKNIYLSSGHGVSSARLSHFLGLEGYHESFDAGCSSSLISVYEGCASLLRKDCDLAIAAGVNLILTSAQSKLHSLVLSPTGRCKTFDAEADGYGRAEGIGVMILKRLSDAVHDRDRIHAIIRGIGVNYNSSGSSFGNPDREGQVLAIEKALKMSNLSPEQITFLEAHGTGVLVGDTVEIEALASVYSRNRDKSNTLFVSSLKANVGHSEAASGMAAIIKVILSMKNELIPPQFPFHKINPGVQKQLKKMHGEIPTEAVLWKRHVKTRFAGVSGFALGGENVHVILEEPPETCSENVNNFLRDWHVLTLSAKCQKSLAAKIQLYIDFLKENPNSNVADVVFSANCCRTHFTHRIAVLGRTIQEIETSLRLNNFYGNTLCNNLKEGKGSSPKICYIFKSDLKPELFIVKFLYEMYPVFKDTFETCSQIVERIFNVSLEILLEKYGLLVSNSITEKCMTFVVNYSLIKLWSGFGIEPSSFMILNESGNEVGSILRETIAGNMSVYEALTVLGEKRKEENKMSNARTTSKAITFVSDNTETEDDLHEINFANDKGHLENILGHLKDQGCYIFFAFGRSLSDLDQYLEDYVTSEERYHNGLWLEACKWSINCNEEIWKLILANLSQLYVNGTKIYWNNFESPYKIQRCKIDLPKYPFQRKRYWIKT